VLPAVQTLFLEETLPSGPVQEARAIGEFVPHDGLPVTLFPFLAGKGKRLIP